MWRTDPMVAVQDKQDVESKVTLAKGVLSEAHLADCERGFLSDELLTLVALQRSLELYEETGASRRHVVRRAINSLIQTMADKISKELPSIDNPKERVNDLRWALYASEPELLGLHRMDMLSISYYLQWWELRKIDEVLARIKSW